MAIFGLIYGEVPDLSEAAEYPNSSERFVRRLVAAHWVAFHHVGHHVGQHVRIALSDLDTWLADTRVEPITRLGVCEAMREVA